MAIIDVTDQSFATEVESKESGLVLVDFWAPWCGPCKMQAPILDEVASELGDKIKIAKMNVDQNTTSERFGVLSIPTLVVFKDGEMVSKIIGLQQKEQLLSWLNEYR
ncbi:thioredoxin [Seinonella peptonophila]|uniref:Thioredoxin n=1 Tax=Seinonella peptonophila TaxID=112248 RepID=A0A1M4U5F0_9BACL|nr:thioredoxin [Seinonella peptonophila]SHE51767.1 thioredoxin [Seinonella peptonophila]